MGNGGSIWEDNCKCGVAPAPTPAPEPCVQDPHCQMTGSACKCTYNGGSTWEDNCTLCAAAPVQLGASARFVQSQGQGRLYSDRVGGSFACLIWQFASPALASKENVSSPFPEIREWGGGSCAAGGAGLVRIRG